MKQSSFPKQVDAITSVASLSKRLTDAHDLVGLSDQMIESVGSPQECSQGSLVFLRPQPLEELQKNVDACQASVLIVQHAVNASQGQALLVTEDPLSLFIKALQILFKPQAKPTVHETAVVSPSARCCRCAPFPSPGPPAPMVPSSPRSSSRRCAVTVISTNGAAS
jgi:UDP-3-O-[3-hydroxymyristoyl] glucosamine N-acyltransferase